MSCVTNEGYNEGERIRADAVSTASTIRQIAAVAIAIDNANQIIKNYKAQRDIAKRSLKISRELQDHAKSTFWPYELDFLNEYGTPETVEEIEVMGRRYGGRLVATVAQAFAKQIKSTHCNASRYCTSATTKALQDLYTARSLAQASARALGRNIAFAEYQARHDRNFDRRLKAIALGKNLMGEASSLLKSAGAGLASVGAGLGQQLNSALAAFGAARTTDPWSQQQVWTRAQDIAGTGTSGTTSTAPYSPATSGTGVSSAMQSMTNVQQSTDVTLNGPPLNVLTPDTSTFAHEQAERMNEGNDIGYRDLARSGSATFKVEGGYYGWETVTVNMESFPLKYYDAFTEGDSPP